MEEVTRYQIDRWHQAVAADARGEVGWVRPAAWKESGPPHVVSGERDGLRWSVWADPNGRE